MESWRTTQIHERIDPPRGINNIQSNNQNVGRKTTSGVNTKIQNAENAQRI